MYQWVVTVQNSPPFIDVNLGIWCELAIIYVRLSSSMISSASIGDIFLLLNAEKKVPTPILLKVPLPDTFQGRGIV